MNKADKNTMANNKKRNGGFTLLEVLVAMSIITIGLLAIGLTQISAINGNGRGRTTSQAATLAADQMERLLAFDYDDIELNNGCCDVNHERQEGSYAITWAVAAAGTANVKIISVTVTSDSPNFTGRDVTLNGLKSDRI